MRLHIQRLISVRDGLARTSASAAAGAGGGGSSGSSRLALFIASQARPSMGSLTACSGTSSGLHAERGDSQHSIGHGPRPHRRIVSLSASGNSSCGAVVPMPRGNGNGGTVSLPRDNSSSSGSTRVVLAVVPSAPGLIVRQRTNPAAVSRSNSVSVRVPG